MLHTETATGHLLVGLLTKGAPEALHCLRSFIHAAIKLFAGLQAPTAQSPDTAWCCCLLLLLLYDCVYVHSDLHSNAPNKTDYR